MTRIAKLDYPKLDIKMYVSTPIEEQYRITACAKEPWTVAWIESMPPGSVLYDVGACVGSYSLIAAALGHQVVAIEPSFANYNRLCENILLNDLGPNIIPLCMALGNGYGDSIVLLEQELQPGYSGGAKRLRVPLVALHPLIEMFELPEPTHVKLDVDGHEADVIEGALPIEDVVHGLIASWLVEVQTGQEQRIQDLLGAPKAIFDQRNGQKIKGMSMMLFERASVGTPVRHGCIDKRCEDYGTDVKPDHTHVYPSGVLA